MSQSLFAQSGSSAGANLLIVGDDILIYSGPSLRYRPLAVATRGSKIPVSLRQVPGSGAGQFYKVLVTFQGGDKKRIGYISTEEAVQVEKSEVDEEVDKYKSLALANKTVQFGLSVLKERTYEWTLGYVFYFAPNLYMKGLGGQILNSTTANFILGVELGLDQLMFGAFSLYTLVGGGTFFPASQNAVFQGSSSTSEFAQGGVGIRYNSGEYASVSLGLIDTAFFNNDNAFLSLGYMATFEVGL